MGDAKSQEYIIKREGVSYSLYPCVTAVVTVHDLLLQVICVKCHSLY